MDVRQWLADRHPVPVTQLPSGSTTDIGGVGHQHGLCVWPYVLTLTASLAAVLARRGFLPLHDRGRVLTDVAVAIASGGRDMVDVEALRGQVAVFGPVASDTTVLRAPGEIGDGRLAAIGRARAAARAHVWSRLPAGVPEPCFAGGVCEPGTIVPRIDGTLVNSHSKRTERRGGSSARSAITRWRAGSTTPASWPA